MNATEFAQKVRAKYPGSYDSLDDNTLTQKILTKYPQYSSMVDAAPAEEKPGMLKSAAAGLMSGVPLAESATAGISSLIHNTPYAKEHDDLEKLKDDSWAEHPVAYGAGKTAGLVGTGLAVPAGIPGAIGVGAASGLDNATSLADVPGDVAKGAAIGGVMGTLGEKVVSPFINKVLPKAAKGAVSSLAGGAENVDTYLANPEGVQNALGRTASAEKLADRTNDLYKAAGHFSDDALAKLRPDVAPISVPAQNSNMLVGGITGEDTLTPLFTPVEQSLTVNGTAVGQAQKNALNALQGYKDALTQIAQSNGGKIPETALGKIVRDMQHDVNWNVDDKVVNSAKKQFEGTINELLKRSNPEYGAAMEPVSDLTDQVGKLKKTFRFDKDDEGNLVNSDTTNSKMGTVLDESKSNAQELLNNIGDFTGFDFLKNAKFDDVKRALNEGGKSNPILNVLGHTGGYVSGRLTGIPGGGLVGSLIGGTAAHATDGGQIAAKVMDTYLSGMKSIEDSGLKAAYQKYAPLLINAAKQGGTQLAATHYVLATSHPEYQKIIQHTEESK